MSEPESTLVGQRVVRRTNSGFDICAATAAGAPTPTSEALALVRARTGSMKRAIAGRILRWFDDRAPQLRDPKRQLVQHLPRCDNTVEMRSEIARLLVVAVALTGTASAQDLPPVRNTYGAFAFPNLQGTELIVLHDVPRAAEISTAICDRQMMRIGFVRRQAGAAMPRADRDSPEQFVRLAGSVFEVAGRRVQSGVTCFVAADPLFDNAELLPVQMRARPRECTAEEQHRAAAFRSRVIRRC